MIQAVCGKDTSCLRGRYKLFEGKIKLFEGKVQAV
jgi:hypothetical protein